LRRQLLARRATLSRTTRAAAERRITALIARRPWLRPGARVGLYVSRGSEVSTAPVRALAARRGARAFLPRILNYRAARMEFVADRGTRLRTNRFRIGEPAAGLRIAPRSLSVVLLPVVGFDAQGHRLGSGAGYYDRLLAFRRRTRGTPLLVGIAFECQRCPAIDPAPHDVPLDAVVTESGIQYFTRRQ
jgi:5-formyltetrahydrofolate cyclo-ligase